MQDGAQEGSSPTAARDALVDHYDRRAATYDDTAMHRDLADEVARLVDPAEGATVLDVGTGTGLVLRALERRVARLRLLGVDLSPVSLGVARIRAGVAAAGAPYGFEVVGHREWRHRSEHGEDHLLLCELGLVSPAPTSP